MSIHGCMDVNLFMCGGGPLRSNATCLIFHGKLDNAIKQPWVGAALYGNPEYIADFITRTLQKAVLNLNILLTTWHSYLCSRLEEHSVVLVVWISCR